MSPKVKKIVGDPDAIVIFTSVVSHKMVISVEEQAKKRNIPIIRHKNNSKAAFSQCLEMVDECTGNCRECKKNKLNTKINMNKNIDLISKIDIRSIFCMNEVIIFLKKDKI